MKNPWPIGITLFFVVFAGGIAAFVVAALRKPDGLVRSDYYEHEIAYQQQIDKELRTAQAGAKSPAAFVPGTGLVVALPAGAAEGSVELYRPSDAAMDRTIPYAPGPDGRLVIPPAAIAPGVWRVRINWKQDGHACYAENRIQVTP